jgi:8-oxo-dGTP pyrophosphatase MutT (NUDIX family)
MPYIPRPPTIQKWQLASTTAMGSFKVFDVRKHAILDAAGKERPDVFTFACPDWCNVVAVTDDDEIVFVWQYRFGTDALGLEIPGGVIDPGESPIDAARRELLEETGYTADSFEPFGTTEPNPALQGNVCHTFLARGARLSGATNFDELEELEVARIPAASLADLIDHNHVTHALVIVALERFLRSRR